MKPKVAAAQAVPPLALALAVVLLAGCSPGVAPPATDRAAAPTTSSPVLPEPAATSSAAPATTSTPSTTATGASSADVSPAVQSALGLFEKVPRNPKDPAAGYLWGPASDTTGHLSRDVAARLAALHGAGYFSAQTCAANYFTGSQNLLDSAPTVVSATADAKAGGTVTVVIRRPVTPARPDLTVVMTRHEGVWLATELATGRGPSASIFAAKPNC